MTTHRPIVSTGVMYHVFNKSIDREPVFVKSDDLNKILTIVDYYRFSQSLRLSQFMNLTRAAKEQYLSLPKEQLIDIYAFSFMPNHYHIELKQLADGGVSRFLSTLQNSFAKYYNLKKGREGGLFRSSFQAKRITTNEVFIHISRYIHLNHATAHLLDFEELKKHSCTSLSHYMDNGIKSFINKEPLMNHFKTNMRYMKFLANHVNYQRTLKKIKDLLLD